MPSDFVYPFGGARRGWAMLAVSALRPYIAFAATPLAI
jgi:hypothetical protein